jgi:GNAT superfamily N-acetyltransferase/RimJ/RimL family protein N-acetyltransferase
MQIERIDLADDDVLRACHAVHAAAAAADDPLGEPPDSLRTLRARLTPGWGGEPSEAWCVLTDGAAGPAGECGPIAAWYRIQFPDLENRDRAFLSPVVHPSLRRRGLGTEMITHARRRAVAQGRAFIDSQVIHGSAGEAFARRFGAESGILDARRILDLRTVPAGRFAELKETAAGPAAGYSLVSWTGATPEDRLAQVAGVINAMNDAPREEGWFEDDIWDADRVRTRGDSRVRLAGYRGYSVAAVHDGTGEMAALTQAGVDPAEPAWGHQGLTAVTRLHRGYRLGLLTKAAMMEWLATAEPRLERVTTTNASVNSHMIAVNEALGYRLAEPGYQFFALPVS